ncbi:putative quinol monooxygenase [Hwanghaeella sp.]|jgi:quinol monooxygenase YgiN|uniref:putative quinol monooxygenase n=1 Tax=Hwanghaeella sp. TaxID=2605943 RepID=UPI003CCB97EA
MAFVIIPEFRVKEDKVEAFKELMTKHSHNSVTKEEGCLGFDCCQDQNDPTRFVLYEIYVNAAALDVHRASEHFAWYNEQAKDLVIPGEDGRLPQKITFYDRTACGAA